MLSFDFQVALQAPALLALSVMEQTAGPERTAWAEARLRQAPGLSEEERLDLLVVLGSLAARRFGTRWLSQSLRSVMLDSPFWDEVVAEARARTCVSLLSKFARARKLALPSDVDERLVRLELAALEQLCELAVTAPDDAAAALLAGATSRPGA